MLHYLDNKISKQNNDEKLLLVLKLDKLSDSRWGNFIINRFLTIGNLFQYLQGYIKVKIIPGVNMDDVAFWYNNCNMVCLEIKKKEKKIDLRRGLNHAFSL